MLPSEHSRKSFSRASVLCYHFSVIQLFGEWNVLNVAIGRRKWMNEPTNKQNPKKKCELKAFQLKEWYGVDNLKCWLLNELDSPLNASCVIRCSVRRCCTLLSWPLINGNLFVESTTPARWRKREKHWNRLETVCVCRGYDARQCIRLELGILSLDGTLHSCRCLRANTLNLSAERAQSNRKSKQVFSSRVVRGHARVIEFNVFFQIEIFNWLHFDVAKLNNK